MKQKFNNLEPFSEPVTCSFTKEMEESFSGRLNFIVNNNRIETFLYGVPEGFEDKANEYIYGIMADGKPFTLIKNQILSDKRRQFNVIGLTINNIKIISEKLIISDTWFVPEKGFNKVSFNFDFIDDWIHHYPIQNNNEHGYDVKKQQKNLMDIGIESIKLYEFRAVEEASVRNDIQYKSNIKYIIEYENEKNYLEILKDIRKIQNFFTVLFSRACYIKELNFFNTNSPLPSYFSYYFTQLGLKDRKVFDERQVIKYNKISDQLATLIKNWLSNYDKYEMIIQNIVGDNELFTFGENKFLNSARNLERYYKINYPKTNKRKEMTEEERNIFEELFKQIQKLTKFKKETLDKIRKYVKNAKITMKQNTNENNLYFNCFELIPSQLLNGELLNKNFNKQQKLEINMFSKMIKETRNHITHVEKNLDMEKVLKHRDLVKADIILEIVLKYLILKDLNMEESTIVQEILTNGKYKNLYLYH